MANEMKPKQSAAPPSPELSKICFFLGGVRSGTTVFRRMLATHPMVRDKGEIFNSHNPQGYFRFFRDRIAADPDAVFPENNAKTFVAYLESLAPKNGIALVDVKYEHMNLITDAWQLPFSNPPITRLMTRYKFKVIHLRRQHFYSVLSNLVAVQTGRYHVQAKDAPAADTVGSVTINRDLFVASMKKRRRAADVVDSALDAQQRLSLDYEKVFDPTGNFEASVCKQIAEFLGIEDQFNREPALKKVIDRPLSDVVANFDEIKDLEAGPPPKGD